MLLDYCSWAHEHFVNLDPFRSEDITLEHLQSVVADQKLSFKPGDILLIRSGFTEAYDSLSSEEQIALSKRPRDDFAGVEPTKQMAKWLWENQFAAVAGDAPAFERAPVGRGKTEGGESPEIALHQWLLGGWGMPIGEMFDLEKLAKHCRETGRWTFFVTSVPLKIPGGVASPPNAVAVF